MLFCIPLAGVSATAGKTLPEVVSHAVLHNPDVNASWYTFRAAREEKRAAQGGYLPSVDLTAQVGSERTDTPTTTDNRNSTDSVRLTLTQMLFDGFAVRNNVARLDATSLARYYDLRQVSEERAQQAAESYIDVMRFQKLVELAKQNYIQHRLLFDDIEERAEAGISRRVDMDQARGRLALAETNLLTEVDNLHDVQVRFQRVVGLLPAAGLQWPTLPDDLLPEQKKQALQLAYAQSPAINSAIENLNAAQSEARSKNSPLLPRFDLRLRQELEHDRDGVDGRFDDQAVEVVMTYNLYKGGTHSAEKRQFHERVNAAKEQRITACQDVRQIVAIAYNNISSIEEQLQYLTINREATGKARDAYREQFDIGQRSLLDLLDQENEYFQARRSFVNAESDLIAAQIATLAGMGKLLESLRVVGYENLAAEGLDLKREVDKELQGRCPAEAPSQLQIDKEALFEKVMQSSRKQKPYNVADLLVIVAPVGDSDVAEIPLSTVYFDFASTFVKPEYEQNLQNAAEFLKSNPDSLLELEGHADQVGEAAFNKQLSEQRAESVKQKMLVQHGLEAERLKTAGRGESMPLVDDATSATAEQNRRVEFKVQSVE